MREETREERARRRARLIEKKGACGVTSPQSANDLTPWWRFGWRGGMTRFTRIELKDGWYHVTARGNERRAIFRTDRDREHFLVLLEEMVRRFGVRLHAYVLMDNHYHLVVETPEANLSRAMQWLGVSYTTWFNRRHARVGHLFQGRFKAIVLEGVGVGASVSQYVHLNPVRVKAFGLDKSRQRQARVGVGEPPSLSLVQARLHQLREYPWSSYRAYVGWAECPAWLTKRSVLEALGGRRLSGRERAGRYRRETEELVREGLGENPWERLEAELVLGGREFIRTIRRKRKGDIREQPALRRTQVRADIDRVKAAVEQHKGERWEQFRDRHGDWGRDLVLYLGQRNCGLKLQQLAELAGGVDDATAGMAIKRFRQRLEKEPELKRIAKAIDREVLIVGT
jgi:putative transposase